MMDQQTTGYITEDGREIGGVLMEMRNITLRFGGVTAIKDISFDIRQGEIRAIIGPNGAGKTSMLNVINGFYHPQEGQITFRGETRSRMRPYMAAKSGISRTFQNVALFAGMTTLDNIMAGRALKMHRNFFWQMLRFGPAMDEEIEHRRKVEEILASSQKMGLLRQDIQLSEREQVLSYKTEFVLYEVWFMRQPHMEAIFLNYNDVVISPEEHLEQVRQFLGLPLDLDRMVAAIDRGLYRNRAGVVGTAE